MCERWGAPAKAQCIRSTYAAVLALAGRSEFAMGSRPPTNSNVGSICATHTMFSADLETVIQASQAIANEVIPSVSLMLSFLYVFLYSNADGHFKIDCDDDQSHCRDQWCSEEFPFHHERRKSVGGILACSPPPPFILF